MRCFLTFIYREHAIQRMFERDIFEIDVENFIFSSVHPDIKKYQNKKLFQIKRSSNAHKQKHTP